MGPCWQIAQIQARIQTWTGLKASSRRVRAARDPNELPPTPRCLTPACAEVLLGSSLRPASPSSDRDRW